MKYGNTYIYRIINLHTFNVAGVVGLKREHNNIKTPYQRLSFCVQFTEVKREK